MLAHICGTLLANTNLTPCFDVVRREAVASSSLERQCSYFEKLLNICLTSMPVRDTSHTRVLLYEIQNTEIECIHEMMKRVSFYEGWIASNLAFNFMNILEF